MIGERTININDMELSRVLNINSSVDSAVAWFWLISPDQISTANQDAAWRP